MTAGEENDAQLAWGALETVLRALSNEFGVGGADDAADAVATALAKHGAIAASTGASVAGLMHLRDLSTFGDMRSSDDGNRQFVATARAATWSMQQNAASFRATDPKGAVPAESVVTAGVDPVRFQATANQVAILRRVLFHVVDQGRRVDWIPFKKSVPLEQQDDLAAIPDEILENRNGLRVTLVGLVALSRAGDTNATALLEDCERLLGGETGPLGRCYLDGDEKQWTMAEIASRCGLTEVRTRVVVATLHDVESLFGGYNNHVPSGFLADVRVTDKARKVRALCDGLRGSPWLRARPSSHTSGIATPPVSAGVQLGATGEGTGTPSPGHPRPSAQSSQMRDTIVSGGFTLCLSGGGLRATLFHAGVISYLAKEKRLSEVARIYAVSGGSVLAAHLAAHWEDYKDGDALFRERVAEIVVAASKSLVSSRHLALTLFFPHYSNWLLRRRLKSRFSKLGLTAVVQHAPRCNLVITDVSDGSLWTYELKSRELRRIANLAGGVNDKRTTTLPVEKGDWARFVAMSAAFPLAFMPHVFDHTDAGQADQLRFPGTKLFADGGIFDNVGGRAAAEDGCQRLFLSDAGNQYEYVPVDGLPTPFTSAIRAVDILMKRVLDLEHVSLAPEVAVKLDTPAMEVLSQTATSKLVRTRTAFDSFSVAEISGIWLLGYAHAEQALATQPIAKATPDPRFKLLHEILLHAGVPKSNMPKDADELSLWLGAKPGRAHVVWRLLRSLIFRSPGLFLVATFVAMFLAYRSILPPCLRLLSRSRQLLARSATGGRWSFRESPCMLTSRLRHHRAAARAAKLGLAELSGLTTPHVLCVQLRLAKRQLLRNNMRIGGTSHPAELVAPSPKATSMTTICIQSFLT